MRDASGAQDEGPRASVRKNDFPRPNPPHKGEGSRFEVFCVCNESLLRLPCAFEHGGSDGFLGGFAAP